MNHEDATIIMGMKRVMKWLIGALCVSGLGALGEVSVAALIGAALSGGLWKFPASTLWWLLVTGVVCSQMCLVIGIVLGVVGLRRLGKP